MDTDKNYYIYSDGGSRGNPGKSACGFLVRLDGNLVTKQSKYLGITTNNKAEYWGVYLAFEWIVNNINNPHSNVIVHVDSELVCRQINMEYRVKDEGIKIIFDKIIDLQKSFLGNVKIVHVIREKNKDADFLVNECLDKH